MNTHRGTRSPPPVMLKAGWWGAADLCGPGPAGRSSRSVQQVGDVAPRFDTAAAAGLQDAQSGGGGRPAPPGAGAVGDPPGDDGVTQGALGLVVGCALERCTRSPGAIPGRQTLAPAGSTWSGPGGDKWSEAL